MIDLKIRKELKKYPNLRKYALHFDKTEGTAEKFGYLPFLVIWFRQLFQKTGIQDDEVPALFGYDDESEDAQMFWSWGHNSRYNHIFSMWLEQDINYALMLIFDIIEQNNIVGFDPDVKEIIEKERQEQKKYERNKRK